MAYTIGFIGNIGWTEWIVILVVMLLLFGRRLPEVGRSLGKGIVEFKKGLKGVEDEVEQQSSTPARLSNNVQTMPPAQGQPNTVSRGDAAQ